MYRWFLYSHNVFHFIGLTGYVLFVLEIMGFAVLLPESLLPVPLLLVSYGLYFGVLSRDCAEWTADTMNVTLGVRNLAVAQGHLCGAWPYSFTL